MCRGSISPSSCKCCMFVSHVQPVAMRSAVFCTVYSVCMIVVDAMADHMVEAYSSMVYDIPFYVESIVSLCFPYLVDERTVSIGFGYSVVCEFGVEGET